MMRCTVVWLEDAQNDLAEIWVASADRDAVNKAAAAVDRNLIEDASEKGVEVSEGLRAMFWPPLRILYLVRDQDRIVEVLRVRPL
jgi:plasmid stabilization system protein ParE